MGMNLVTGTKGSPHVTGDDFGALNQSIFGNGRYVTDIGNQFGYTVVSNNQIRIIDGEGINQGRHFRIKANDYVDCAISNGEQGKLRNDIIVARYTLTAGTGIENCDLVVVEGTAGGTATDPTYTSGDIRNGAAQDDMPLYRVRLNGLNIEGIDILWTESKLVKGDKILDTQAEVVACTEEGFIMGALAGKQIITSLNAVDAKVTNLMFTKIVKITGTSGSNNVETKIASFPIGATWDNVIILSCRVLWSTSTKKTFGSTYMTYLLKSDGIYFTSSTSEYANAPLEFVIGIY